MIITHNIGIIGAQIRLTALASLQGNVIRQDLQWQLKATTSLNADQQPKILISEEPQPLFTVTAGVYQISIIYRGNNFDLGEVQLKQNTHTDTVFVLEAIAIETSDDYFADFTSEKDFLRRATERDEQSIYGGATLPLRDPNLELPPGDNGIPAHPLLKNSVQFDGVPPDFRPDPNQNAAALQLTYAAQLQNNPGATPSPTLSR